jgi:glycosyltransferase involved in cell wall biosynthesis
MLAVFKHLWDKREDVQLVIVGRHGWLMEDFMEHLEKHPEQGKKLFWLTGVSDEFLAQIYEACSCLLAASIDEGFGLPLVEAIQHGKPILARDIEVFREFGGSNKRYFKNNKNDFINCIDEINKITGFKNKTTSEIKNWKTHVKQLKNKIPKKEKIKKNLHLVRVEKETTRVINVQKNFQLKPNPATGGNQKMAEIRKAVSSILLES